MAAGGEHGQRGKSSTQLASSQTSAEKERERCECNCAEFVCVCVFVSSMHVCEWKIGSKKVEMRVRARKEKKNLICLFTMQGEGTVSGEHAEG